MREPAISGGEAPSSSVDLLKSLNQSFHLSTTPSALLKPRKGLFFSPPTRQTMQLNNQADVRHAVLSQSFLLNSLMVTARKRSSTLTGSRSQSCFVKDDSVVLRLEPGMFFLSSASTVDPQSRCNQLWNTTVVPLTFFHLHVVTNCLLFRHEAALSFDLGRLSTSSCGFCFFFHPTRLQGKNVELSGCLIPLCVCLFAADYAFD